MLNLFKSTTPAEFEDRELDLSHLAHTKKRTKKHRKNKKETRQDGFFTLFALLGNLGLLTLFYTYFSSHYAFIFSFLTIIAFGSLIGFILGYWKFNFFHTTKWLLIFYGLLPLFKHSIDWTAIAIVHFIAFFIMTLCGKLCFHLNQTFRPATESAPSDAEESFASSTPLDIHQ